MHRTANSYNSLMNISIVKFVQNTFICFCLFSSQIAGLHTNMDSDKFYSNYWMWFSSLFDVEFHVFIQRNSFTKLNSNKEILLNRIIVIRSVFDWISYSSIVAISPAWKRPLGTGNWKPGNLKNVHFLLFSFLLSGLYWMAECWPLEISIRRCMFSQTGWNYKSKSDNFILLPLFVRTMERRSKESPNELFAQ